MMMWRPCSNVKSNLCKRVRLLLQGCASSYGLKLSTGIVSRLARLGVASNEVILNIWLMKYDNLIGTANRAVLSYCNEDALCAVIGMNDGLKAWAKASKYRLVFLTRKLKYTSLPIHTMPLVPKFLTPLPPCCVQNRGYGINLGE